MRERESKRLRRFVKVLFSFLFFVGLSFIAHSSVYALAGLEYGWTYTPGSTGDEKGIAVEVDSSGNIYAMGQFSNTVDFDPGIGTDNHTSNGGADVFISKYNAAGTHIWTITHGNTLSDGAYDITVDSSGNVYATGFFYGTVDLDPGEGTNNHTSTGSKDVFLTKYDSGGNLLWAKSFGGTLEDRGVVLVIDSNNLYLQGTSFSTSIDFDPGDGDDTQSLHGSDVFVSKFNISGEYIKTIVIGGASATAAGMGLAVDSNGNVYHGGDFIGTVDFDPGFGTDNRTSAGNYDLFLTKYNSGLEQQWTKTMGNASVQALYSCSVDSNDNVYCTGEFEGTVDFDPGTGTDNHAAIASSDIYITKFGSDGSYGWTKTFGGSSYESGLFVTNDIKDNVFITGFYMGAVDFDPGEGTDIITPIGSADAFITKFDSNGNYLWTSSMGGTDFDIPSHINIHSDGSFYWTGFFKNTADFDITSNTDNHTSTGNYDFFLSKYTTDVLVPSINLTSLTPDPTTDITPSLTGTATDVLGTVASVEYQVDSISGSWISCIADDGIFDEASEAFTCTVSPALVDGAHTIYVRATDSGSNTTASGSETTNSFTVDSIIPTGLTLDSPSGYSKDATKPTLVFKKATDSGSGISSYSVSLDSGKNLSYLTTGIPVSGNGTASYIWKDDSNVKVEFTNENDSDTSNDQIKVYFKGLDSSELTEGAHSWKVTAYDNAGNSKEESKDFYLDKTSPSISELAIANVSTVAQGHVYKLEITNRTPSFSGKATDSYQGSTKTNTNGIKDSFDKVSSGPETVTLKLFKLKDGQSSSSSDGEYEEYSSQELNIEDIKDENNDKKTARFYITTPFPLVDGYYKVQLIAKDKAENEYTQPDFYLSLNYVNSSTTAYSNTATSIKKKITGGLDLEITDQETTQANSQEEKQQVSEEGYTVRVKVVDDQNNPVSGAKVTIHSKVQETTSDENGIATFNNVEQGDHRIIIAYDGFEGEKAVTLTGDVKEFSFDIRVTQVNPLLSPTVLVVIGILVGVIVVFAVLYFRAKARKG